MEADCDHVIKQQVHHQVMVKVNYTAWEVEVVGPEKPTKHKKPKRQKVQAEWHQI